MKITLVIFFIVVLMNSFQPFNVSTLLLGVFIIGFFSYTVLYLPDKIEFDDENMYIVDREGEVVVGLKDIFMLRGQL